ncbi:MAG: DNA repair protein RecO [Candidatus Uhrbacteria bacterium]
MTYTARGIVLRREDVFEWDRRYTVFTKEYGKLILIGKGTRRPKAKLAAHLEPFTEAELVVAHGRNGDRFTFARALKTNAAFAVSEERLRTVSWISECVDQLTREQQVELEIFNLLQSTFAACAEGVSQRAIIIPFTLRLLSILGFAPALDHCMECRTPILGAVHALSRRGGVLCARCHHGEKEAVLLSSEDRHMAVSSLRTLLPVESSPILELFVLQLLEEHIVAPMRTVLFMGVKGGLTWKLSTAMVAVS